MFPFKIPLLVLICIYLVVMQKSISVEARRGFQDEKNMSILGSLDFLREVGQFGGDFDCDGNDYFSTTRMECVSCSEGKHPNLERNGCQCQIGFVERVNGCEACQESSSRDGMVCQACNATTMDLVDGQCVCKDENSVLIEKDGNGNYLEIKRCFHCGPRGKLNTFECRSFRGCEGCTCSDGYTFDVTSGECLLSTLYTTVTSAFSLDNLVANFRQMVGPNENAQIRSEYYRKNFYPAAVRCYEGVSMRVIRPQECNHLANLCAAELYDTDAPACSLFASITNAVTTTVNGWEGWKARFPFLFHGNSIPSTSSTIPSLMNLDMHLSISSPESSKLQFFVSTYTLNGTWLGFQELTDQLNICGWNSLNFQRFRNVATNAALKCNFNVYSIVKSAEPKFFDLFLTYDDKLYPVPIQILRGRSDAYSNPRNGPLFRRFFLYDNFRGQVEGEEDIRFITLLNSAYLRVKFRSEKSIYPPILTLRYSARDLEVVSVPNQMIEYKSREFGGNSVNFPRVSFWATYSASTQIFDLVILSLTIFLLIMAVLRTFLQSFVFLRKREFAMLDLEIVLKLIGDLAANFSNVFFLILLGGSCFLYWFFKYQTEPLILLPQGINLTGYYVVLSLAIFFKFIDVVLALYKQTHIDIFFIDWEKPRKKKGVIHHGVGWRTILIAKTFVKLCTERLVNLELSMFLTLLLLRGFGLMFLSTEQPNPIRLSSDDQSNSTLRFASVSMVWIGIFLGIFFFKRFFYLRFIKDPVNTLVDLCSISNISLFLLTEQHFGYYIHGASVHDQADITMSEFDQNIVKEKNGAVLNRGLIPDSATPSQTFQMYITQKFRADFNEHFALKVANFRMKARLNVLPSQQNTGAQMKPNQTPAKKKNKRPSTAPSSQKSGDESEQQQSVQTIERRPFNIKDTAVYKFINPNRRTKPDATLFNAYSDMNEFLKKTINEIRADYLNRVRVKEVLHRVFGLHPQMTMIQKNVLYNDSNYGFSSLFIRGMEFKMLVFNILLFALFDLMKNEIVSMFLVYLINLIFVRLRKFWTLNNLINKTIIDPDFFG